MDHTKPTSPDSASPLPPHGPDDFDDYFDAYLNTTSPPLVGGGYDVVPRMNDESRSYPDHHDLDVALGQPSTSTSHTAPPSFQRHVLSSYWAPLRATSDPPYPVPSVDPSMPTAPSPEQDFQSPDTTRTINPSLLTLSNTTSDLMNVFEGLGGDPASYSIPGLPSFDDLYPVLASPLLPAGLPPSPTRSPEFPLRPINEVYTVSEHEDSHSYEPTPPSSPRSYEFYTLPEAGSSRVAGSVDGGVFPSRMAPFQSMGNVPSIQASLQPPTVSGQAEEASQTSPSPVENEVIKQLSAEKVYIHSTRPRPRYYPDHSSDHGDSGAEDYSGEYRPETDGDDRDRDGDADSDSGLRTRAKVHAGKRRTKSSLIMFKPQPTLEEINVEIERDREGWPKSPMRHLPSNMISFLERGLDEKNTKPMKCLACQVPLLFPGKTPTRLLKTLKRHLREHHVIPIAHKLITTKTIDPVADAFLLAYAAVMAKGAKWKDQSTKRSVYKCSVEMRKECELLMSGPPEEFTNAAQKAQIARMATFSHLRTEVQRRCREIWLVPICKACGAEYSRVNSIMRHEDSCTGSKPVNPKRSAAQIDEGFDDAESEPKSRAAKKRRRS